MTTRDNTFNNALAFGKRTVLNLYLDYGYGQAFEVIGTCDNLMKDKYYVTNEEIKEINELVKVFISNKLGLQF